MGGTRIQKLRRAKSFKTWPSFQTGPKTFLFQYEKVQGTMYYQYVFCCDKDIFIPFCGLVFANLEQCWEITKIMKSSTINRIHFQTILHYKAYIIRSIPCLRANWSKSILYHRPKQKYHRLLHDRMLYQAKDNKKTGNHPRLLQCFFQV